MHRLLIVEDERKLRRNLEQGLNEAGYEVLTAASGEEGYYCATTEPCDALVLDVMLPGRDGLEILRDLRAGGFAKPVLMLTARDTVEDRVNGLDRGADDYLVKPFAFADLLARLRALLRREVGQRALALRADNLELDLVSRRVVRDGIELELSNREFQLLEFFLRHRDVTVTREMIARDVWKETDTMGTNVIDVYVNLLRKKIERRGLRQLIHTVRGVGYVLRHAT